MMAMTVNFFALCLASLGPPILAQQKVSIPKLQDLKCVYQDHGVGLPTHLPLNIAHRGSSGVLPEHTLPAYRRAIADGADVIECDLALTSDLHFVCRHESWLSLTTDIADREEFAHLKTSYTLKEKYHHVQETKFTDWFTVDMTLADIKQLGAVQRFPFRDQSYNGMYEIATLDEFIRVGQEAQRKIGYYIELKHPDWVNAVLKSRGQPMTVQDLLLEKLTGHGLTEREDGVLLQSFFYEELVGMAKRTKLPLLLLVGRDEPLDISEEELELWERDGLYGIGLRHNMIADHRNADHSDKNWIKRITDVTSRSHVHGLKVHVYTFRNEDRYLAWDYEQDPYLQFALFYHIGIDGFFTDFPGTLSNFFNVLACKSNQCDSILE